MTNEIKVTELNIYPIKSTAGLSCQTAKVEKTGLLYDRSWGVFDDKGQVITGRDYPQLLGIRSKITSTELQLDINSSISKSIPLSPTADISHTVRVFSETAVGIEPSPELSVWFSNFLGISSRLLFMADPHHRPVASKRGGKPGDFVTYADECPILLLSEASLAELNGRLDIPVTMAHFRPNIVVSGCAPFAEDNWTAVQIGDTIFDIAQACKRCVFTTIDPITQEKSPTQEPLRTLTTYRKVAGGGVNFGVHLIPRQLGTINIGDTIKLLAS